MKSEKVPISGLEGGGRSPRGQVSSSAASLKALLPRGGRSQSTLPRPSVRLGSAAPVTQPPAQRWPRSLPRRREAPLGPRRRPGWGSPPARPPALPRALAFRLPETGPAGRGPAEPRRRSGNASPRPRSAGARGAAWRGRVRAARRRPPRSRAPGVACGPGRRLGRPAGEPTHDALARGRRQRSPRRSPVPARSRAPHGRLLHFTEWRSGLKHPQHSGSVHSGNTQPSTKLLGRL